MRPTGTPNWLTTRRRRESPPSDGRDPGARESRYSRQIWAIGGGKGGIGKTFLAANLAAVAARSGRTVTAIDLDLGGANLHTCLGVKSASRVNLSDYLDDRIVDLEKAAIDTPIPGLRLILGALGRAGAAETTQEQRVDLLRALRQLPSDIVILDLAAGTDRATIDFFLVSDQSFIVTTPEPTAIENAYAFLRGAFYRRLSQVMTSSPVRDLMLEAMSNRNERGIRSGADLLREIERLDSAEGERFRRVLEEFRPRLILNYVRSGEEIRMGFSIQSVCRKHFGFGVEYVGYVNFDDSVWKSVKARRPLVLAFPQSDGSLYVRRIVKRILES